MSSVIWAVCPSQSQNRSERKQSSRGGLLCALLLSLLSACARAPLKAPEWDTRSVRLGGARWSAAGIEAACVRLRDQVQKTCGTVPGQITWTQRFAQPKIDWEFVQARMQKVLLSQDKNTALEIDASQELLWKFRVGKQCVGSVVLERY